MTIGIKGQRITKALGANISFKEALLEIKNALLVTKLGTAMTEDQQFGDEPSKFVVWKTFTRKRRLAADS